MGMPRVHTIKLDIVLCNQCNSLIILYLIHSSSINYKESKECLIVFMFKLKSNIYFFYIKEVTYLINILLLCLKYLTKTAQQNIRVYREKRKIKYKRYGIINNVCGDIIVAVTN